MDQKSQIVSNFGMAVSNTVKTIAKYRTYVDFLFVVSEKNSISNIIVVHKDMEIKDIIEGKNKGKGIVNDALLIIEVFSESTYVKDCIDRFVSYNYLSSLTEVVHVFANRSKIEFNTRLIDNSGRWIHKIYKKADDTLKLKSIGLEIKLSEIYDKVEL